MNDVEIMRQVSDGWRSGFYEFHPAAVQRIASVAARPLRIIDRIARFRGEVRKNIVILAPRCLSFIVRQLRSNEDRGIYTFTTDSY